MFNFFSQKWTWQFSWGNFTKFYLSFVGCFRGSRSGYADSCLQHDESVSSAVWLDCRRDFILSATHIPAGFGYRHHQHPYCAGSLNVVNVRQSWHEVLGLAALQLNESYQKLAGLTHGFALVHKAQVAVEIESYMTLRYVTMLPPFSVCNSIFTLCFSCAAGRESRSGIV